MIDAIFLICLWGLGIFLMLFGAGIALEDRGELGSGIGLAICGLVLMFHLGTG